SAQLIADFYTQCLDVNATQQTCSPWNQNADQAHKTCEQCLVTTAPAQKWGALVVYKGNVDVNVGGCIAVLDPNNVGCAQNVEAKNACDHAACDSVCPVTDNASYQLWQQCVSSADVSCGCQKFAVAAKCADKEQNGPAASCVTPLDFK